MAQSDNMKRVMYIDYGMGFGGSIVSLAELLHALWGQRLVDPLVVTSQEEALNNDVLRQLPHLYFRRLLSYRSRDRLSQRLKAMKLPRRIEWLAQKGYATADWGLEYWNSLRLLLLIRKHKVDLLHVNNGWRDEAIRAAHWAGVPCILHARGFGDGRHLLSNRTRVRWMSQTVRGVIVISDVVGEYMVHCGIPKNKVVRVYNPIDIERYSDGWVHRQATRDAHGFNEEDVVVSMFGRVMRFKGQLEFLEGLVRIGASCPRLKAMIVGDASDLGNSEYGEAMDRLIHQHLQGRVVLAGYQVDVEKYYWASDIVVLNSLGKEGFGRVIAEAMACQRPVVAADHGGPSEIITQDKDGLLFEPRSITDLASAIEKLYHNPRLRLRLGSEGRRTVSERFRSARIAEEVASVYARMGV